MKRACSSQEAQCHGCALKCGGEANREPDNHLIAVFSVLAGIPFYCHDTFLSVRYTCATADDVLEMARRGEALLCAGWRAAVKRLHAAGFYRGMQGKARREIARIGAGHLKRYINAPEGEKEREDLTVAESCLENLLADAPQGNTFADLLGLRGGVASEISEVSCEA